MTWGNTALFVYGVNILQLGNYFADLQISGNRNWSVDNGHQVDTSIVRGDLHKLSIALTVHVLSM